MKRNSILLSGIHFLREEIASRYERRSLFHPIFTADFFLALLATRYLFSKRSTVSIIKLFLFLLTHGECLLTCKSGTAELEDHSLSPSVFSCERTVVLSILVAHDRYYCVRVCVSVCESWGGGLCICV